MTAVRDRPGAQERPRHNSATTARRSERGAKPGYGSAAPSVAALQRLQASAGNAAVSRLLEGRRDPAPPRGRRPGETSTAGAGPALTGQLPAHREDLDGHQDLLTGAALVGAPVIEVAQRVEQPAAVQRISLNPLDWAKKVWNGIKSLGSTALSKARSLGSTALSKATAFGSGMTSKVGAAITGALSALAGAARSGLATLGGAAKSALQTLGNLARNGLSAAGRVARGALDGALRLGRGAWDRAASVGRRALDVAIGAGRAAVNAGRSLASTAWGAVKGRVGGLWNGLKAKATALKDKVLAGAKGLLAKATSLGGRAVDAATGVVDKIGGSICSAVGRATGWVYDKVAPLARQAWEWAKKNPAKAIAALVSPGGALIAAGVKLQQKMLGLAKELFAPVVKAVAAKARAAWNTAKQWGARAFSTAKQWAGRAVSGATALGRRALSAAAGFGRSVVGKARHLGGMVVGKAKQWGRTVLGKAKDLGGRVWGTAKRLGGKLLGLADSLTGGMASRVKGLADKMLGKAAGVLSWVMSKARSLASRALSSARALASRVLSKAKNMASAAWNKAKSLGSTLAGKARAFASGALAKGKALLAQAGRSAVAFGRRAVAGAKSLAGRAVATAKQWGAKAWSTAKRWGATAWAKAKELGGAAWDWTKRQAGQAWDWAKGIGARLAPYARRAWDWAKRVGKAIGVDKAVAAATALGKKALGLAMDGLALLKDKVLPVVEKLRQVRNKMMSYTAVGALCKAIGCAYKGVMPKAGQQVEGAADLATDLIPVVSTVKDTCTCLVGENVVTNEDVGAGEQGLACGFAALDIGSYIAAPFTGGGTAAGAIALRTTLKGGIRVGGRVVAGEALEAMIDRGGREFAGWLGREGIPELTERLGRDGLPNLAERMGKEEFGKFAGAAAEQGVRLDDLVQRGAKEAAGEAAERGAREAGQEGAERTARGGADGPAPRGGDGPAPRGGDGPTPKAPDAPTTVKDTPSGLAVCVVQTCRIHGPTRSAPIVVQRTKVPVVVQRAKADEVCALISRPVNRRVRAALEELASARRALPDALAKNSPELLNRLARDPEAFEGLCRLLRRRDVLDHGTKKALIDVLDKHGDNVIGMLRNVEGGINRLDTPALRRLLEDLRSLPDTLDGIDRWVRSLNANYHKMKGIAAEIRYAAEIQGDLAKEGRRIGKVADEVPARTRRGMEEAGDLLLVSNKTGKLDEVRDVKAWDWNNPRYRKPSVIEQIVDDLVEQNARHAGRYPGTKISFVFVGSPPASFVKTLRDQGLNVIARS